VTRSRTLLGLWTVGATLAASAFTASAAAADPDVGIRHADSATAVKDSYIVVLRDTATLRDLGVPAVARQLLARHSGSLGYVYESALQGFSVTVSAANARRIAAEPTVEYVEANQRVSIEATQSPTPSWGLDRIDQRDLPLNNSYTYPTTASNVRAYIIDTGIRFSHTDFGGRAVSGRDTVDNDNDASDCNGHGTHVAGTVGGGAYGVAKGVQLVGVRVLNCQGSGTNAGVIAGVDWVTANAVKPAVANMSLGGGADSSLDTAVRNSVNSGISYALAAGNSNANACNSSPSRVAEGITVGASTRTDARASFSNYGTCLDIFAPGQDITSAWYTSDTATNTISGTSMAAPHVAGAAALYLATNTGATPTQVRDNMVSTSTLNKITNPGSGSPNRLLYVAGSTGNVVTVTNPGSRTATVGTATSLQITASSSGGGALTYSATGLPPGLSINSSSGLISGTPTTTGTYTTTVTATDSTSATGSATFSWTVHGRAVDRLGGRDRQLDRSAGPHRGEEGVAERLRPDLHRHPVADGHRPDRLQHGHVHVLAADHHRGDDDHEGVRRPDRPGRQHDAGDVLQPEQEQHVHPEVVQPGLVRRADGHPEVHRRGGLLAGDLVRDRRHRSGRVVVAHRS